MAAIVKSGTPFGLAYIQISLTGTNGRSYGQAGGGLASGATSHAYLLRYPKTAGLPTPERPRIDFQGGDVWIGSHQFPISSFGDFTFNTADVDGTLNALITGSKVDITTNAQWTEWSENVLKQTLPTVSVIITYRIQSTDPTNFGQNFWFHYVIPQAIIAPNNDSPAFQAAGEFSWKCTPTTSARRINGLPFTTAANGYENNKTVAYRMVTENPVTQTVHIANSTTATFTSAYLPITSAVGTATNSKNHITKGDASAPDTTAVAATTVTVATKEFVVGSVVSGDYVSALYETAFAA